MGWVEFKDRCYFFAHEAMVNYSQAVDRCGNSGAQLVTITNKEEQEFLAGEYNTLFLSYLNQ